ncbi:hypothetical protein GMMP15_2120006 [Candidatus Magnetomoraceae bacterium gMMP-15]
MKKKQYPKFGSAKGLIEMSDDFDAPLKEFEEYIPFDYTKWQRNLWKDKSLKELSKMAMKSRLTNCSS